MIAITKRQRELLDFIKAYMAENGGLAPSVMEMARGLDLNSTSNVHSMLTRLEERGVIRRLKFHARAIQIVDQENPVACVSDDQLVSELTQRGWTVIPPSAARPSDAPVAHGVLHTSQVQQDHV